MQMEDCIAGKYYNLDTVSNVVPESDDYDYQYFPLKNIRFIRSYNDKFDRETLVFIYRLKYEEYDNWSCCWKYIPADSTFIKDEENNNYLIETHILKKFIKITPVDNLSDFEKLMLVVNSIEKRLDAVEKQLKIV
jgi:hypothetical protein